MPMTPEMTPPRPVAVSSCHSAILQPYMAVCDGRGTSNAITAAAQQQEQEMNAAADCDTPSWFWLTAAGVVLAGFLMGKGRA